MATEKLDFTEVLTVLEAKRSALDTLIGNFKAAMSLGALGLPGDIDVLSQSGVPSTSNGGPVDLPTGAFLNKSIPAAVTLYLSAVKKKQTVREIATALKEGGLESTAKNFEATLTGALYRLRIAEKVLRFPDGWALAEFYPDRIRASVSQAAKPKTKKKRKPRKKAAKSRHATAKPAKEPSIGLEQRIESVLVSRPSQMFTPTEIGQEIDVDHRGVMLALARMAKKKKSTKVADGRYCAYNSDAA